MQFRRLTELEPQLIERLCSSGSVFSHPSFATVWTSQGGTPVWWVAQHEQETAAIIPGIEFGRRPVTRFQAMPDGCYANPIGVAVSNELLEAVRRDGYFRAFLYDFDNRFPLLPGVTVNEHSTRVVDISAEGWEPPDSNLRSEIRKAERDGVIVRQLERSRDMDAVLRLATSSAEHHQQALRYRERFYGSLAGLADDTDLVRWYVAEHNAHVIAVHIYLVHHSSLLYWQAYVDRDHATLRPNQLMTYRAVQEARTSGLTHLNLGATPPGADGLRFYKERWGGDTVRYRSLHWRSFLGRLLG